MTPASAELFGRTQEQWDEFVEVSIDLLLERGTRIFYGELNNTVAQRTGLPRFDLETEQGRKGLGHILGDVNDRTIDDIQAVMGRRAMLSALVWLKDSGDQFGKGFYQWGIDNQLLAPRNPGEQARLIFAAEQTGLAQTYCRRRRRRRA